MGKSLKKLMNPLIKFRDLLKLEEKLKFLEIKVSLLKIKERLVESLNCFREKKQIFNKSNKSAA